MKVGTRLALMMLLFLTPIVVGYAVITARSAAAIFSEEVKDETRIAERALNASLTLDAEQGEWNEAKHILSAMRTHNLIAALFDTSGTVRIVSPGFPIHPPRPSWIRRRIKAGGATEFMSSGGGHVWFCRIEPLGAAGQGYLLVGQNWTALSGDLHQRIVDALTAMGIFLLLAAVAIAWVSRRYITLPLAELRRRISKLGAAEDYGYDPGIDEVNLISQEFRRLDRELSAARVRLLQENERKLQLERRLRQTDKLATIGTLASGLAHEIGTPLGVIRGRTEMLLDGHEADKKLADNLRMIIEQIDRITINVRVLLDLGRRRESVRTIADVRTIVASAVRLLENEAARRGVEVIVNLGPEPLTADCDADQLQQVFINLEINALDAMVGGGKLHITGAGEPVSDKICIRFADSGPGVPAHVKERIFDPFFTTKDPGKGTGMGLAVSQSIVIDHDGELLLEPSSAGAAFAVYLHASHADEFKRSA